MSYYCPPTTTISKKFLTDAFSVSKNLIVLGDLNAHHTSGHSRKNNQSGSILDEILFNIDCTNINFDIPTYSVSDSTLWKKLNSIDSNSKPDRPQMIILKQNNVTIDNPEEISNIFAKLLAKIFSHPEDPNFDDQFKTQVNNSRNEFFKNNEIELTNSYEIQGLIDKLKPKGAPDADRVTNKAIKKLTLNFIEFLVEIVNASLKLAHLPSIWKIAHIIMIPKPMKDHSQPENFGPISLLNMLSKLCERVIQVRINRWLLNNNIISNYQSGFCKGKQTNDHLFRFIESSIVGFNRGFNKGLKTAAVFIDIEKAFVAHWIAL